jgi:hypothetical protein
MRRFWPAISVLLVAFLLAVCVIPFFVQWSPLNCWHEDVDITTGRIRRQWILLFVKVSEVIEETPLSKVVSRGEPATEPPEWHRVNTFSPGIHYSPHYRYHGAGFQIRALAELWNDSAPPDFPAELKEATARHVLALWREGSDYRAGDYIMQLYELVDNNDRSDLIETIGRIKMPKFETIGNVTRKTLFFPSGRPMERFAGYRKATGEFIPDGVWESWYANGKRASYGHFHDGRHDGRRFNWDRDGKLISIQSFDSKKSNLRADVRMACGIGSRWRNWMGWCSLCANGERSVVQKMPDSAWNGVLSSARQPREGDGKWFGFALGKFSKQLKSAARAIRGLIAAP